MDPFFKNDSIKGINVQYEKYFEDHKEKYFNDNIRYTASFPEQVILCFGENKREEELHILINRASTLDGKKTQLKNLTVVKSVYGFVKFFKIYNFVGHPDIWGPELLEIRELAKKHILFIYARRLNRICRFSIGYACAT